jgi:hypothetical protein
LVGTIREHANRTHLITPDADPTRIVPRFTVGT